MKIWEDEELRQRNLNRTAPVKKLGNRTPTNTATLGGSFVTVFIGKFAVGDTFNICGRMSS